MCELLGMSANVPTDICFSFTGLMQRGGLTGPHRDGWGIAFYEGRGCRTFHDPNPSAESEVARFIQRYSIKSEVVISHIRRANHGRVCLVNTHPFVRELWGRFWTFAHNGQLKGIKKRQLYHYKPVGTTDSEHAFCWLLDRIREQFPSPPRNHRKLWRALGDVCQELNQLGVFNLLLSDSRYLYAFCSTHLYWITRRAPFGRARLRDIDFTIDFNAETTPDDVVTVLATKPLTDNESWHEMPTASFDVFLAGAEVA
jgi:glutamine amidotransferase